METVQCESRTQRLRKEALEQLRALRNQKQGRAAIERYLEHLEQEQQAAVERTMEQSAGWWRSINNRLECLKRAWAANGGPDPEAGEGVATSPLERFILVHPTVYHLALFEWCGENLSAKEPGGMSVDGLLTDYHKASASANAFQEAAKEICLHPATMQSTKRTWNGTHSTSCDACGMLLHRPTAGIYHRRGYVEPSNGKLTLESRTEAVNV